MINNRRSLLKLYFGITLARLSRNTLAMGLAPPVSGMRKITGNVFINNHPAKVDQLVHIGDTVSTGPRSEAIYVVGRNAYQLRENTVVEHGNDGVKTVLRIITGGILAVFGSGEKRIELNTATVGIRGSGFYSEVLPNLVYFCLCYGIADIVPLADESQARHIVTTYHDSPLYIGSDLNFPLLTPAPVKNHTNAELEYLERISGRPSPFTSNLRSEY